MILSTHSAKADRVIFLHRDPRDTVVSMFYEMTRRQVPRLSPKMLQHYGDLGLLPPMHLGEFVRSSRFGIQKVAIFNLRCKEMLKAHELTYEELHASPLDSLRALLKYVGVYADDARIGHAIEANSFTKLRSLEESGDVPEHLAERLGPTNPSDSNSYKARRGKVGSWRDELTEDTRSFANEILSDLCYFERMSRR